MKTAPTLCGSISTQQGSLGRFVHNAAYEALGLDFRYVSIGTDDLERTVGSLRQLGFRGFAITMPYKRAIVDLLDCAQPEVRVIGACNTVVIEDGRLIGFNTDWTGARMAIEESAIGGPGKAVVVGAGGVARAISYALKTAGWKVFISARNRQEARTLADELGLVGGDALGSQGEFGASLVVNATPDARFPGGPVELDILEDLEAVMDVSHQVRTTELIDHARRRGLHTVAGWRMYLHQAIAQFEIYTKNDAPRSVMANVVEASLDAS